MRYEASIIYGDFAPGGTNVNGRFIPRSLKSFCPHCSERVVFSLSGLFPAKHEYVHPTRGSCPNCSEVVFFTLHYSKNALSPQPVSVSMFPSPSVVLESMPNPPSISDRITRAITDAETAFRAGLFSAALTSAGRAFEGLIREEIQATSRSSSSTLARLIDDFTESESATRPIKQLAKAIRHGRNAGAHFDDVFEADQESAELIIRLLRYFLLYFVTFEQTAEELSRKINSDPLEESG